MDKENDKQEIFSERVRAGKRTYFFDVKATRSNDYYLTITESKRMYKEDGFTYEKHKIFLYKEDFNKFIKALGITIDHVKNELMPEVDFTEFDRRHQGAGHVDKSVQDKPSNVAESEANSEDTEDVVGESTKANEEVGETGSAPVEDTDVAETKKEVAEPAEATEGQLEESSDEKKEETAKEPQETGSGIDSELKWD